MDAFPYFHAVREAAPPLPKEAAAKIQHQNGGKEGRWTRQTAGKPRSRTKELNLI
jgi:hypothetical protein